MARKVSRKTKAAIQNTNAAIANNIIAMDEFTRKHKSWSLLNMKTVHPLNEPQRQMFESFYTGNHIIADGSAGTGKTYSAIFLALSLVLSKDYPHEKIIIVRSAVPSREIGFLPGTQEEKLQPYETPYRDIVGDIMQNFDAYDSLKDNKKIIFMPTSFVRGLTWDNSIVILDEAQNYTWQELNSILTRIGVNTRIIVIGDYMQNDLVKTKFDISGMHKFLQIAKNVKSFDYIGFTKNDIVRSDFVKEWIVATEEYNG